MDFPPLSYWGGTFCASTKHGNTLRIGFVNIRGFGSSSYAPKNKQFACFAAAYEFDVIGTAENNVNWKSVPIADRPLDRSLGWWQSRHVSYSFITSDPVMQGIKEQRGGTAVWTRNSLVHRASEKGGDSLGHRAWTRFRGQNNQWLRVVSAYCPVVNTSDLNSTYNQQLRLLPSTSRHPRDTFLVDLQSTLAQWSALGDLLIVMLDANQDVRFGALAQVFGELDMINAMYDPLPLFHHPVLPTGPGHLPIDGIFVSRSIHPSL